MQKSLKKFLSMETLGGILMLLATVLAFVVVNIPAFEPVYTAFKNLPLTIGAGATQITFSMDLFVKDGLMTIFFLLVGLELKKEMLEGQLAQKGQKILPLIAAFGGCLIPALIYIGATYTDPEMLRGWGVPTATDIAFALAVLLMIKKFLPESARMFLMAIAVYDDLMAIMIIALFYGGGFNLAGLAWALGVGGLLFLMNKAGVTRFSPYLIAGSVLAFFLHEAGIHMTIAGVLTAMAIPLRSPNNPDHSPVSILLHALHAPVAYGIVPLFAFLSAGVNLSDLFAQTDQLDRVLMTAFIVGFSLWAGKQIGIWMFTRIAVDMKIAPLPKNMTMSDVYAVSCLAGVGFTMSLFVGSLAFTNEALHQGAILGVLIGSLLAAVWGAGFVILKRSFAKKKA